MKKECVRRGKKGKGPGVRCYDGLGVRKGSRHEHMPLLQFAWYERASAVACQAAGDARTYEMTATTVWAVKAQGAKAQCNQTIDTCVRHSMPNRQRVTKREREREREIEREQRNQTCSSSRVSPAAPGAVCRLASHPHSHSTCQMPPQHSCAHLR